MDDNSIKKFDEAEIAPSRPGDDLSQTGPTKKQEYETKTDETVGAKPDGLPMDPLLGNSESESVDTVTSQEPDLPCLWPVTPCDQVTGELAWVPVGRTEVRMSADTNVLMMRNALRACTDDSILLDEGVLPILRLCPPQGHFRGDVFVVLLDWGLLARARRLLDASTLIPVIVYRSAAAAKPLGLHQLGE